MKIHDDNTWSGESGIRYFAHTKNDGPWESLETHLKEVGDKAGEFGAKFGFATLARQIGLWHDIGKYSPAFQSYLRTVGEKACQEVSENAADVKRGADRKVDHSTPGAKFALSCLDGANPMVRQLVFGIIAGHHTGLLDHSDEGGRSGFKERIAKNTSESLAGIPCSFHENCIDFAEFRKYDWRNLNRPAACGFQLAFLTRMLFSCLVDADFLCTERFMNESQSHARNVALPDWLRLSQRIDTRVRTLSAAKESLDSGLRSNSGVLNVRKKVRQYCLESAQLDQGFFELNSPTGTGKTLSSLSFAVDHALRHGLDRIIYALPFTTIVEQTSAEFLGLSHGLGPNFLIEHHSNLTPEKDTTENRLASENWDAPLVVTTNVQLFESLFASRTSACRKLHNLARSVIVLDEPQALPPGLLLPCLRALEELQRNYRVSVLFCSATVPAIGKSAKFVNGIKDVREIVPATTFESMPQRVRSERLGVIGIEELAARIADEPRAMCIVNTRAAAQRIFRIVKSLIPVEERESLFHLSTWMCGQHRGDTLKKKIKNALSTSRHSPCRVISTQVVEAGVDLDFPVVFRELAGLDSLTQAAGRCNREGRSESGRFFIFELPDQSLRDLLRLTVDNARTLLTPGIDPLDSDAVRRYFELTYWTLGDDLDKHRILKNGFLLEPSMKPWPARLDFRTVSDQFRMIDSPTESILVPYTEDAKRLAAKLRNAKVSMTASDWRQLQRYCVNVHRSTFAALLEAGALTTLTENVAELSNDSLYCLDLGLDIVDKCLQYFGDESTVV